MSHHAPRGPLKHHDPIDAANPLKGQRCTATNRQGNRCGKAPIPGGTVCRMHGGAAPQVKLAAQERLKALQTPAISALEWLLTQRDFPSAAMSAARDVLDRTEGKAPESMDLHVTGSVDVVSVLRQRHQRAADLQNP